MTNGKDEYVHFEEGGKLTPLGEKVIGYKERVLYLHDVKKTLVLTIRDLLGDMQDIQEVSSPESVKKMIELPDQYQKFSVDTNIIFLNVLLREINDHIKNVRGGVYVIENMKDVLGFVDYVDMVIYNELSQLTDNDPRPMHGQKYLNSPAPKRPDSYPWDDGYPPDYPDDDNEEGKNGS